MKTPSSLGGWIKLAFRRRRGLTAALLLVVLALAGAALLPPQLLRLVIDRHLSVHRPQGLSLLAAAYLGALLLVNLLTFLKEWLLVKFGQHMTKTLREGMMEKAGRIRAAYFTDHPAGETSARFLSDVDTLGELFTDGVVGMAADGLKVFGILASIWMFSPALGGIVLALLLPLAVMTRLFQKAMLRAQKKNRAAVGQCSGQIAETLKNIRTVKSGAWEARREEAYEQALARQYQATDRVNFFDALYSPLVQLLRAAAIAAIAVTAARGGGLGITAGMVAASIDLITGLFAPIESLGMELQTIQSAVSGMVRIKEFFALPEEAPKDESLDARALLASGAPALLMKDLSFSYEPGRPVLKNLSFEIGRGETVAIAGRTGVGKTTLFHLIAGIYPPEEGSILLFGAPPQKLPPPQMRRLLGFVGQKFEFIPDSLLGQITLGDPAITAAMAKEALQKVGLWEKIEALPRGLEEDADLETLFSQGEKQLLGIARAIASQPPLLLLDEVTAGLDAATEEKTIGILREIGKKHTILTISHRFASMLSADRVILLEHGTIRAQGTPQELLRQDAWFRRGAALQKRVWGANE